MKKILILSFIVAYSCCSEAAGRRNYTAVTNISFYKLEYIPSNFLYRVFGSTDDGYYSIPSVPVSEIDFRSARGCANRGALNFGNCTNLTYASFDSLSEGCVEINKYRNSSYEVLPSVVVSAINMSSNAVLDLTSCENISELRFDGAKDVIPYGNVNYNLYGESGDSSRIYIPSDLYDQWVSASGWNAYSNRFRTVDIGPDVPYPVSGYDYYLSAAGRDEYDGLSWNRPKRTLDSVWAAANARTDATNFTCAVFAGQYVQHSTNSIGKIRNRTRIDKRIAFKALKGPERTYISAPNGEHGVNLSVSHYRNNNTPRPADADTPNMLMDSGNPKLYDYIYRRQTFDGFTLDRFTSAQVPPALSQLATGPTFAGMDFVNCVFTNNVIYMPAETVGSVFSCRFDSCKFVGNYFVHSADPGSTSDRNRTSTFWYCTMTNTVFKNNEYSFEPSQKTDFAMFKWSADARNCLFDADTFMKPCVLSSETLSGSMKSCTFVLGSADEASYTNAIFASCCSNCYICVSDMKGIATGGVDNVYGQSWTNTYLDAEGWPTNGCPAIRTDGRGNAGWRETRTINIESAKCVKGKGVSKGTNALIVTGSVYNSESFWGSSLVKLHRNGFDDMVIPMSSVETNRDEFAMSFLYAGNDANDMCLVQTNYVVGADTSYSRTFIPHEIKDSMKTNGIVRWVHTNSYDAVIIGSADIDFYDVKNTNLSVRLVATCYCDDGYSQVYDSEYDPSAYGIVLHSTVPQFEQTGTYYRANGKLDFTGSMIYNTNPLYSMTNGVMRIIVKESENEVISTNAKFVFEQ